MVFSHEHAVAPGRASAAAVGEAASPAGELDREQFRVSRKLRDAPAGLTVLLLDPHVLARSNELRDVRLVDANGRQVPYLVEHRTEPMIVPLAVPPRHEEGTSSVYGFELPYNRLPAHALVLTTSARVFERQVTLRHAAGNHRRRAGKIIDTLSWRSADPELLPPALRFELPHRAPRAIEIVVDEQDNAPLPIASAQLLLPPVALRFHHPGGPLFLLYGNREAAAPRYDLTLLAPRLMAEPAREITLAPPAADRGADGDVAGRRLFWAGIVIAAVVLIAMLLRLLLVSGETSHARSDTT